jgi:hypothetical protein
MCIETKTETKEELNAEVKEVKVGTKVKVNANHSSFLSVKSLHRK